VTPLQFFVRALADALFGAREELTDEQYECFVWIATEMIGLEAARLAVGEALRALREEGVA
jgi:hypothetical protein